MKEGIILLTIILLCGLYAFGTAFMDPKEKYTDGKEEEE